MATKQNKVFLALESDELFPIMSSNKIGRLVLIKTLLFAPSAELMNILECR